MEALDSGSSGESPAIGDPTACDLCGQLAEIGRSTPLCASCRSRLAARPLPRWILISAAAMLVPFVLAIAKFPAALAVYIALERGHRAEADGNFSVALTEYTKAVGQFPNSTFALARKGIAAFHAGEYQVAEEAFDTIDGREGSSDIVREVNDAMEQLKKLRR